MIRWTKQFYKTIFSTIFHRRKFSFIHKRDYTRNKRIARYQPQKKKIIKKGYKNITLTVKNLKKYRYFYYPQSACFAIAKEIKKKKKNQLLRAESRTSRDRENKNKDWKGGMRAIGLGEWFPRYICRG